MAGKSERHALGTVLMALFLWPGLAPAQDAAAAPVCKSTATGDLRLHQLDSKIFGNQRTLRVLLPPRYDAAENRERRYPVLYLLDGQNLFDACLSDVSHREWGVDETVYRLIAEHEIRPLIVVGIDYAGEDRAHEYLPYPDFVGDPDSPEPEGARFPDFLASEVLPFINAQYRTLKGAANTGIGGSSYGGDAALYAMLARPAEFGYGLFESTPLWIGMGQLVRDTNPLTASPVRVYVGWGSREVESSPKLGAMQLRLLRQLRSNFHAAGYNDSNFRFVLDPEGRHNEDSWARRLPGALKFLFGDCRLHTNADTPESSGCRITP